MGAKSRSTPARLRLALVGGQVARVGGEVGGIGELRRVQEDARDDGVGLLARRGEERAVPGVQGAHRRDEPDRALGPKGRKRMPQLGDRSQRSHRSLFRLQFRTRIPGTGSIARAFRPTRSAPCPR